MITIRCSKPCFSDSCERCSLGERGVARSSSGSAVDGTAVDLLSTEPKDDTGRFQRSSSSSSPSSFSPAASACGRLSVLLMGILMP